MRTWELEAVTFNPVLRQTSVTASSREQASAVMQVPTDEQCFVRISLSEGDVSRGEFELWCSGDRAVARILEHREHDARDLEVAPAGIGDAVFRYEDGSPFTATFAETVPRELAVEALRSWVQGQDRPSVLVWS